MKTRLEQLVSDAGERMKELQKRCDGLNEEWHQEEKNRARYAAAVASGSTFQSDKKNLCEATEKTKGLVEQLDRARADIAGQQQYVANISNQYLELVRVEKGVSAPQSQYSSNSNNGSMFASSNSSGPRY